MQNYYKHAIPLILTALACPAMWAQTAIPVGARIFIASMDGYGNYIRAAMIKKKLPLVVVEQREDADFELSGAVRTASRTAFAASVGVRA